MIDLRNKKEATLVQMLDYLLSKINFGKVALDNKAIICMDKLFKELHKQKDKYEI